MSALSFDTQDGVSWTHSGDLCPYVKHHTRPLLQLLFAHVPLSYLAVSPWISWWFVFTSLSPSPLMPPSFHSPGRACLKTITVAILWPPLSLPSEQQEGLRVHIWSDTSLFPLVPILLETGLHQPAGGRVFHQHLTALFLSCTSPWLLSTPTLQLNADASSELLSWDPSCPLQSLRNLTFTAGALTHRGSQRWIQQMLVPIWNVFNICLLVGCSI